MQQDSSQRTVIIATLAFIVGFGLAWLIATNKMQAARPADQGANATSTELASSTTDMNQASLGSNFIKVADQPEGVQVTLQAVGMAQSGWVVIHEDDNGAPGHILGAQLFDAGSSTGGTVDLLRGMVAGRKYYAMLHTDNGDRAFDPKKDTPVLADDGTPIMATFTATAASSSSQ